MPQVRRYKLINLRKGAFGPIRPRQVELLREPLKRATSIVKKVIPIEHSPTHTSRFELGVQHMAEPDETAAAQRNARMTVMDRQGDFKPAI